MRSPNSTKKLAVYTAVAILVAGSLFGFANSILNHGQISQTSSSAVGQQGVQNQAAQSSIAIESASFVTGRSPSVTVTVRDVGAVDVALTSIAIQGNQANSGFSSSVLDTSLNTCYPSSTLREGDSCSYTSTSPDLAGLREGDVITVKVTTSVGTFASAQLTVSGGATLGVSLKIRPPPPVRFNSSLTSP